HVQSKKNTTEVKQEYRYVCGMPRKNCAHSRCCCPRTPLVLASSLPNYTPGTAYTASLVLTGRPPFCFAVISGALPSFLTFNPCTGTLSSALVPASTTGSFTFGIAIRDSCCQCAQQVYTLNPCSLALTPSAVSETVDQVTAIGPFVFTVSGGPA